MSTVPIWFQERFRMVPEPVLEPAGSWRPYLMRGQAPAAGRGCPLTCAGFVSGKETDDGA